MTDIIFSFLGTILAFIAVIILIHYRYGERIKNFTEKFAKIEKLLNRFL